MPKVADKRARKSVRTTVSVPSENYAELETLADQKKVSVAWVIRDAIDLYLQAESLLFRTPPQR